MRSIPELLRSIYARLTAGGSTEAQAVQSGIWAAGINVGDRVLQLIKVVVLARLLSPEAFGLLGIALLTMAGLKQFSKLGFDEALIQNENEDINSYLNTAWVMKAVRGAAIAVVAFAGAPYLATFFGEPQAGSLIRVIGITPLILGLQNPAVVYFQKNMNFHREFVYQVGSRVVDLTVAVAIAYVYRTVWALAAGIVALNIAKFAMSYGIHEYRPNIEFNLEYGKEMFAFGKWMFASAILMFVYGQGDDAFVGWFFGASALGFYQIAYRFSNAPATEVTHVISRVAFPAFSKVQNDKRRLREGYFRTIKLSSIIGFPMAVGIIAVSPQFVPTVFGNQWDPMIPLMQILAIWGGQRALGANVGAVFKAVGRPDYDVKLQAINVALIAIFIYPVSESFGIIGLASLLVAVALIKQPIGFYIVLQLIDSQPQRFINILTFPLCASTTMGLLVISIDKLIFPTTGIVELIILVFTGIVSYSALLLASDHILDYKVIDLYKEIKHSII